MTAKEILKKYFHGLTDEQFEKMVSEYPMNNVFGAMNEYARLIAENAVEEHMIDIDHPFISIQRETAKLILSRIKTLTEE